MLYELLNQVYANLLVSAIIAPFVALSGYWIATGMVRLRQLWQIGRGKLTALSSVQPGETEVLARIVTATTYESPLFRQVCVAHYYTVERFIVRSRSPTATSAYSPYTAQEVEDERLKQEKGEPRVRHWARVASESSAQPFLLADQGGCIAVDPHGARMDFGRPQYEYETDAPDRGRFLPEPLHKLVLEKGIDANASLRFREWLLRPGESVLAVGMARERAQVPGSMRSASEFPHVRYELCRSDACELLLTNLGRRFAIAYLSWQGGLRVIAGTLLAVAIALVGMYVRHRA